MRKPTGLMMRSRFRSAWAAIFLVLVCVALSYLLAKTEHPATKRFLSHPMSTTR